MTLWNARALTYIKANLLKTRGEDILLVNETWSHHPLIPAYNGYFKDRGHSRGGGVAIYVKQELQALEIPTTIEETIILQITFNRNKKLYVVTSYFPNNRNGCMERWNLLRQQLIQLNGNEKLKNFIIACDWNNNVLENSKLLKSLKFLSLTIPHHDLDWTYCSGTTKSKIDFFVHSDNITTSEVYPTKSVSDHRY